MMHYETMEKCLEAQHFPALFKTFLKSAEKSSLKKTSKLFSRAQLFSTKELFSTKHHCSSFQLSLALLKSAQYFSIEATWGGWKGAKPFSTHFIGSIEKCTDLFRSAFKELSFFQQKSSALFNKRSQLFLTKELLSSFKQKSFSALFSSFQYF